MLWTALLLGVPVAAIAGAVVYVDAARRDLPTAARLRWSGGVAGASLAGFILAFGLDDVVFRHLAGLAGTPVVVTHPRQVVASLSIGGTAISAVAVLAYGFGSRFGHFEAA